MLGLQHKIMRIINKHVDDVSTFSKINRDLTELCDSVEKLHYYEVNGENSTTQELPKSYVRILKTKIKA